ncbi:MAG TPA: GWxTD domain-containing protein [bacterium]
MNAMGILILYVLPALSLNCEAYRFDQGYSEIWYTLPAADIFSFEELESARPNVTKKYHYRLVVHSKSSADSAVHEGMKSATVDPTRKSDYLIDFIPVFLGAGQYRYQLDIDASGDHAEKNGELEIFSDTVAFTCSDLILSEKVQAILHFAREGVELTPLLAPEFAPRDTMMVYTEAYGLIPDSLYFTVRYIIVDTAGAIVFSRDEKRLKYDFRQIDTAFIAVGDIRPGPYKVHVAIYEPVLNKMVTKSHSLDVKERALSIDLDAMTYAFEIDVFLSADEYRQFCDLDLSVKKKYLDKFWSRHDYKQFEERLMEADAQFSTSNIIGRRTHLGKYYILNGPPDEIEYRPMEATGDPSQVWHYHTRGLSILFVDSDGDGDYDMRGNVNVEDDFLRDFPGPGNEE